MPVWAGPGLLAGRGTRAGHLLTTKTRETVVQEVPVRDRDRGGHHALQLRLEEGPRGRGVSTPAVPVVPTRREPAGRWCTLPARSSPGEEAGGRATARSQEA